MSFAVAISDMVAGKLLSLVSCTCHLLLHYYNEATKVQNPRRLCHVHCIYIAILIDSRREEARYNIHVHV